ncbi:PIN2/TERF1-interacting telomerase inhibitor 1 isoform X2 [Halyomorpha halys]|nr:PIN2/TERF1-interacting telomerase inhibitor 1 isoform X2 [Halyomorpha halys]
MLEKMGWQPGMGLGAKGQGRTDFVRLQMKNDTKGLGNKEKYDEVWTRQQENFDSLLAQLNGTDKNDQVEDSTDIPSLEDKSKMSRARVHYHKFTRGKDVSKYSSKDLNCIIGIGKKSSENSSELITEAPISMYDYFRSKSKKSKEVDNVEHLLTPSNYGDNIETSDVTDKIDEAENIDDQCKSKKKEKKRAKRKASDCDDLGVSKTELVDEGISNEKDASINELQEERIIPLKKKKKKRKIKSIENDEVIEKDENSLEVTHEEIDLKPLEESTCDESEVKSLKKKKKKRHKNKENNLEDN